MREAKKELTKRKEERTEAHIPFLCNKPVLKRWVFKGVRASQISRGDTASVCIFEVAQFIKGLGNH